MTAKIAKIPSDGDVSIMPGDCLFEGVLLSFYFCLSKLREIIIF